MPAAATDKPVFDRGRRPANDNDPAALFDRPDIEEAEEDDAAPVHRDGPRMAYRGRWQSGVYVTDSPQCFDRERAAGYRVQQAETMDHHRARLAPRAVTTDRYQGGWPSLSWLARTYSAAAASRVWSQRPASERLYFEKGGKDDEGEGEWQGDAIGDTDNLMRLHPTVEDLMSAASDGRAVRPRGRYAARLSVLADGFPESDGPYRVDAESNWYRHGRAIFNVEENDEQEGLLLCWLDGAGRVQLPREQSIRRKGSRIPICWPVERFFERHGKRFHDAVPSHQRKRRGEFDAEVEALHEAELVDCHLRRRGRHRWSASLPATVYPPIGHTNFGVPQEKAALRAWLAEATAGHAVTVCPPSAARSVWNGRVPCNKQGLSTPDIRDFDEPIEVADDIRLTINVANGGGDLSDIAEAHGVRTTRPDRAGQKLLLEAARIIAPAEIAAAIAANDNRRQRKLAA